MRGVGNTIDRFWSRINIPDALACWEWTAGKYKLGYGYFSIRGKRFLSHRFSYEQIFGPIPDDLEIDHLCRNPPCVNPWHLEPVTPGENTRRGISGMARGREQAAKTHCPQGHPYDVGNIFTYYHRPVRAMSSGVRRICRTCGRNRAREYYRSKHPGGKWSS